MVGRNTQGVTLIRTGENEQVVGLQRIDEFEDPDLPEGEEGEVSEENAEVQNQEEPQADAPADDGAQAPEQE